MKAEKVVIKKSSFGSLVRGLVIGAALGVLFAPRSGQETRDMLTQKGSDLKDRAVDVANDTRDRAQSVISDARNKIQDTVKSASDTVKSVSKDSGSSKEELEREVTILEDINNPNYPL